MTVEDRNKDYSDKAEKIRKLRKIILISESKKYQKVNYSSPNLRYMYT